MTLDELIGELVRLRAASPHGGETLVLLKFEGDVHVEWLSLGRPQLPRGRAVKSPVVLIQAGTTHQPTPMRRLPGRADRSGEEPGDPAEQPDHAEMIRTRLCRALARNIEAYLAATGDPSRPLAHLLRVIETERLGLRGKNSDVGQLWLFDEHPEVDFARALEICEATGAVVVHSGSAAVYQYGRDVITMPSMSRFRDKAGYFITRFHMTAHWAEDRLGWEGPTAVGKLVAVLTSYDLAEVAGVPVADPGRYQEFHAAWLHEIRNEAGFLRRVLGQASRVTDFIVAFGEPPGPGSDDR